MFSFKKQVCEPRWYGMSSRFTPDILRILIETVLKKIPLFIYKQWLQAIFGGDNCCILHCECLYHCYLFKQTMFLYVQIKYYDKSSHRLLLPTTVMFSNISQTAVWLFCSPFHWAVGWHTHLSALISFSSFIIMSAVSLLYITMRDDSPCGVQFDL